MGTLYVVATPIGNREDMTIRALRVLREVDVIAAEDTRHTGQLLAHYGIAARYLSLHEHNERERTAAVIARLDAGADVALVSDAGTPALADPGAHLVAAVAAAGHAVVPIPGPSALTAAVAVAGIVTGPFTFVGFLPAKRIARREALEKLRRHPYPIVLYEAPHRVVETLTDAWEILGDRACTLCRELTKLHEEIIRTTVSDALAHARASRPRGEFVIIIDAAAAPETPADEETLDAVLRALLTAGVAPAAAAKEAARVTGQSRSACYAAAVAMKRGLP